MAVLIIVIVLLILLVAWGVGQYNKVIRARNSVSNAWSQIDVQLKRRRDLIPQLVNTVKGYADHESKTLEEVTRLRTAAEEAVKTNDAAIKGKTAGAQSAAEDAMRNLTIAMNAVTEAYPDLKANTNFSQLQEELSHTENQVTYARQAYNDQAMELNNLVESFPSSMFAGLAGTTKADQFSVSDEDRQVPEVKF